MFVAFPTVRPVAVLQTIFESRLVVVRQLPPATDAAPMLLEQGGAKHRKSWPCARPLPFCHPLHSMTRTKASGLGEIVTNDVAEVEDASAALA